MARRDFLRHLGFELANAMQTNKPNMEKTITESQKIEMLLKPRYRVVADYPGSDYRVDEILVLDDGGGESDEFYFCDEDGKHVEWEAFYKDYPHIFKPLEWWEQRASEEMPGYVKFAKENSYGAFGEVIRVDEIKITKGGFGVVYHGEGTWWATDCLPCTEADYLATTHTNQEEEK